MEERKIYTKYSARVPIISREYEEKGKVIVLNKRKEKSIVGKVFMILIIAAFLIVGIYFAFNLGITGNFLGIKNLTSDKEDFGVITGQASSCVSDYSCGGWSVCVDDIQTRVCKDLRCGAEDIIERRVCSGMCTTNIVCDEWERCNYMTSTENIISGEISYRGYQQRKCRDLNGCVEDFSEERTCSKEYPVKFVSINYCGVEYLAIVDPEFNYSVSRISLSSWKNSKTLDIEFFQSGSVYYCPYCYNAVQDFDETGIDCGGSCKPCKNANKISLAYLAFLLWIISVLGISFFFYSSPMVKKMIIRRHIFKGETALVRGNLKEAKRRYEKIESLLKKIPENETARVKRDVEDYIFKIEHFK